MTGRTLISLLIVFVGTLLMGCHGSHVTETELPNTKHYENKPAANTFTIAVIPDTQNMIDFRHQTAEGFAIDAADMFIQEMQYIADNTKARGGDIAFVVSVGDVWQHQIKEIDEEHFSRGFAASNNPFLSPEILVTEQTRLFELPKAVEGYQLLAETGVPFGVAPGNHDYDAMWAEAAFPPDPSRLEELLDKVNRGVTYYDPDILGMFHVGGLSNFNRVFGSESDFFKDKPWYIASYHGGANAAQRFTAGGYTFLHITLEMQAGDDVLAWAQTVIDANPGLPTIITTHDYLNPKGERKPNPIVDFERADPDFHNSAEDLWMKFVSQNNQIFMVLCGHQNGQAMRVDNNQAGSKVYQILADYQGRGQAGLDAGQPRTDRSGIYGIGDGWFRLMNFDMSPDEPTLTVKTYSSHYQTYSDDLETYATWYRQYEQADMTDKEFYQADSYVISLVDFKKRFEQAE